MNTLVINANAANNERKLIKSVSIAGMILAPCQFQNFIKFVSYVNTLTIMWHFYTLTTKLSSLATSAFFEKVINMLMTML